MKFMSVIVALTARAGQWYRRALFPQSFALADAKLCVDGCKALRLRWAKLVQKSSVLF